MPCQENYSVKKKWKCVSNSATVGNKNMKTISHILILAMLHLCWVSSFAWAEVVPITAVVEFQNETPNPRPRLTALMNREDVAAQLQQHGISKVEAVARINSLTDDEVTAVIEKMDQLPPGGHYSGGHYYISPEGYVFGLIVLWVAVAGSISFITCSARGAVCSIADCQAKYSGWNDCTRTWFRVLVMGEGFPSHAPAKENVSEKQYPTPDSSESVWD